MDMDGREMYYEAVRLAEAGSHEAALAKLQSYLRDHPSDGEALNDAGTILFCMHRGKEAIDYFLRARNICSGETLAQVYWNLCEACIEENRPEIALELLDSMETAGVLNLDVLNRLAKIYLDRDDCGTAMDLLFRSIGVSSEQEVLFPMLEVIRSKRCGLTVAGSVEEMEPDLVEYFRARYPGSVCRSGQLHEIQSAMVPGGILLYFGADAVLRDLTRTAAGGRIVVRLGRQDLYHSVLSEIQWSRVDALVLPDEKSRAAFMESLEVVPAALQTAVVAPGIDADAVTFSARSRGKKAVAMGPWDAKANPMLLLQCIHKLHSVDEDMRFYLTGEFPDPVIEDYMLEMIEKLELDDCVFMDGKPRNWNRWLRDKHYVISAGVDALGMPSVYRAMAAGLKPVVHAFPGASQYLDSEHLFLTADEFCGRVMSEEYRPEAYRAFAVKRCSRKKELRDLDLVVRTIEKQIVRKTSTHVSVSARSSLTDTGHCPAAAPHTVQKSYCPQPTWNTAPMTGAASPSRSIEEIAADALNTARRLTEMPNAAGGASIQAASPTAGDLHGPF